VTDITVVAYHLSGVTYVLAIVTAETTGEVKVTDIVWVCLPIRLHLREGVRLEDSL
jgi:hypothetical protein